MVMVRLTAIKPSAFLSMLLFVYARPIMQFLFSDIKLWVTLQYPDTKSNVSNGIKDEINHKYHYCYMKILKYNTYSDSL